MKLHETHDFCSFDKMFHKTKIFWKPIGKFLNALLLLIILLFIFVKVANKMVTNIIFVLTFSKSNKSGSLVHIYENILNEQDI